jgi:hypothetical protein
LRLTSPLNLPAPGRRQWLYVVSSTWQPPVFLLNSRLSRFSAASFPSTPLVCFKYQRHPFSRSYGVILPSSFSTDHSSTLGFSPRLPVSVYGTVEQSTPARGFSWRQASRTLDQNLTSGTRRPVSPIGGFFIPHPGYSVASGSITRRLFCFRVPPDGQTHPARHGNLDPFPIAYAFRPRLRGRLTRSG